MARFKTNGGRLEQSALLLTLAFGAVVLVLFLAIRQSFQHGSITAGAQGAVATAEGAEGGGGGTAAPAAALAQGQKGKKLIGKYWVLHEAAGKIEERDLFDEPIPEDCYAEPHADYTGPDGALNWGYTYKMPSAARCCQECKNANYNPRKDGRRCNIWVYCPEPSDRCWSADYTNHTAGECWFKFQKNWDNNVNRNATNLVVNSRGAYSTEFREKHKTAPEQVQWISGVIPNR